MYCMWLIGFRIVKLRWFNHYDASEDAILSHTWIVDEVSYEELFPYRRHRKCRQRWRHGTISATTCEFVQLKQYHVHPICVRRIGEFGRWQRQTARILRNMCSDVHLPSSRRDRKEQGMQNDACNRQLMQVGLSEEWQVFLEWGSGDVVIREGSP
jgi:hypothetical protein